MIARVNKQARREHNDEAHTHGMLMLNMNTGLIHHALCLDSKT